MIAFAEYKESETVARQTPSVELTGVGKQFGAKVVLDRIDLEIAPAELLAIVGRSGCGKSTLLRLLVGLESADEGSIRIGGVPLHGPNREARLMFQDAALLPWQTVLENVALAESRNSDRRKDAGRALQLVGLEERVKDWPS